MDQIKTAILKTLAYADVFDFPLKEDEIGKYLIISAKGKRQKAKLQIKIQKLIREGKIEEKEGFYFLRGREKIVKIRKERERESRKKLQIARGIGEILKFIPTIKMVAVTGALAISNSKAGDDIDLLIVNQKGRIWTTRFLATIFVEMFAKRRRPGDKDIANKICLNMFLDEGYLEIPEKEQDLFSGHEVVQLKPLWDRNNTYQKFLATNQWVEKYLPNAIRKLKAQKLKRKTTAKNSKPEEKKLLALSCRFALCALRFALVENALKRFQLWYMRKRRTTEVISNGLIRFHPKDARVWVLKEYYKRLNSLKK